MELRVSSVMNRKDDSIFHFSLSFSARTDRVKKKRMTVKYRASTCCCSTLPGAGDLYLSVYLCVSLNRQGRRKKPPDLTFLKNRELCFQTCIIFAVRSCILFHLSCWMSSANSLIWIFVIFVVLIELVRDDVNLALFWLLLITLSFPALYLTAIPSIHKITFLLL